MWERNSDSVGPLVGIFLLLLHKVEARENEMPDREMCINYFLTFVRHIIWNSQQMLLFIRARVFIECRIKVYAVIYDFIELSQCRTRRRSIKLNALREGERFYLFTISMNRKIQCEKKISMEKRGKRRYTHEHWRLLVIKWSLLLSIKTQKVNKNIYFIYSRECFMAAMETRNAAEIICLAVARNVESFDVRQTSSFLIIAIW